ncbi:hypothetical protein AUP68_08175 [Ilyonectria robusta]
MRRQFRDLICNPPFDATSHAHVQVHQEASIRHHLDTLNNVTRRPASVNP